MDGVPRGACLFFAFADAVQLRLQGTPLPLIGVVPVELIQALSYVQTVCLLAGFVGRAIAPQAIGVPYVKELCRMRANSSSGACATRWCRPISAK
jgi:ABC-type uncharacterized transport system permease subunit